MKRIAVVGSMNMDVVNRVRNHPVPGETVNGLGTTYSPGGKGANQAVAAARAGAASVSMIGAVGRDPFADELMDSLADCGVSAEAICHKEGTSGMAFITVDDSGENAIILSSGANGKLEPADIDRHVGLLNGPGAVLLQNEIPWETTRYAIRLAAKAGATVFFNPAPACAIPEETLSDIDWIVLNETEAEAATGLRIGGGNTAKEAVKQLLDRGAKRVVLTLGENGAVYMDREGQEIFVPCFPSHSRRYDVCRGHLHRRLGSCANGRTRSASGA